MPILEARNIVKHFDGIPAVDGLSFGIEKETITALVGPNGAGKTTFFNIITGFLEQDSGEAIFDSNGKKKDISRLSAHKVARLGIARTFQNIRLFNQMTVLDNLMLASNSRKHERLTSTIFAQKLVSRAEKENLDRANHYLEFVGLSGKRDSLAENLSHGQRKLVSLARAFCLEPDLLLLDEPTAGVFPETRVKIGGLLEKMRGMGKTILFIEHDMHFVVDIADKIIVMNAGKKLREGKPEEVINDAAVIEAYLGKELS
jgi:ABC-type branched-subunit amino acid transport system ATPase component